MLLTPCTSTFCWAISIRFSLLVDQSSRGAACSRVSPDSSRIARSSRASCRRRTTEPLPLATSASPFGAHPS